MLYFRTVSILLFIVLCLNRIDITIPVIEINVNCWKNILKCHCYQLNYRKTEIDIRLIKNLDGWNCDELEIICLHILFISLSKNRKKDNEFLSICVYSRKKIKDWCELCIASFIILKIQLRAKCIRLNLRQTNLTLDHKSLEC